MRRRFFVEQVRNGHAELSGEDARHLTRVLRVEAGQKYEISDNQSVYLAEVEAAHKEQVSFRVLEKFAPREQGPAITLAAALIKFDHFEWMLEKATELGVSRIVPVVTARSEKGLDRAAGKRLERWQRIALEASQQSRRDFLPEVLAPANWPQALGVEAGLKIALDEQPGGTPLLAALAGAPRAPLALLVGPEGGWTDGERAGFLAAGWRAATLGSTILRAETAGLAALAIAGAAMLDGASPTRTAP
jgi:16S rRNA (uracil1498-N3)-methyltransferase